MKLDKSLAIALVVAVSLFMELLDMTAVTTAIPTMAEDFHTNIIRLNLGITSYLITMVIFIPVSGWLAFRFGVKRIFCIAIIIFIGASTLCGFSKTLDMFIFHRIIQGIGAALMTPVGRLAVLQNTSKDKLVVAIAFITWPALIAPIAGPLLGGYLATYVSWHWIFFINVPIGIVCLILTLIIFPKEPAKDKTKTPLDLWGFLMCAFGFAGVMTAIELLTYQKLSFYIYAGISFVVGACLILADKSYSATKSNPLINFGIMKIKTYREMIYNGSLSRIIIGTGPYLIPLMFQTGFGYTPFKAGTYFGVTVIGSLVMKPITVWLMRKFEFKQILITNGLLITIISICFTVIEPSHNVFFVILVLLIAGMTWCIQYSTITTLTFSDIPQPHISNANTLYSTIQQMSTGIGIGLGGIMLHFSNIINHGNINNYPLKDYHLSFIFVATIALISALLYFRLSKTDGDEVRGLKSSLQNSLSSKIPSSLLQQTINHNVINKTINAGHTNVHININIDMGEKVEKH